MNSKLIGLVFLLVLLVDSFRIPNKPLWKLKNVPRMRFHYHRMLNPGVEEKMVELIGIYAQLMDDNPLLDPDVNVTHILTEERLKKFPVLQEKSLKEQVEVLKSIHRTQFALRDIQSDLEICATKKESSDPMTKEVALSVEKQLLAVQTNLEKILNEEFSVEEPTNKK